MSTTDPAYHGVGAVLLLLRQTLEGSGLECSPYIIDHTGNTPGHLIEDTFSLAYSSRNAGTYRDVTPMRMVHTVTVTTVGRLNGSDSFSDTVRLAAKSEDLVRAVHLQSRTGEVRVRVETIDPALSPTREFLITRIAFTVEHDWYGEPLE